MPEILVYTDGGCIGNPGPGGWGAHIQYPDGGIVELGGRALLTTNNRMELTAAAMGLMATLDEEMTVTIITDSTYVKNGITKWIERWKSNGWKTSASKKKDSGTPVKNRDLWQLLDLLNRENVEWRWVKGHASSKGNQRVDAIAHGFASGEPPKLKSSLPKSSLPALKSVPVEESQNSIADDGTVHFPCYVSLVDDILKFHDTWPQCQQRTHRVKAAKFKKCKSMQDLLGILEKWGLSKEDLEATLML